MTISEFYRLVETETDKNRNDVAKMTVTELSAFIKNHFGKQLLIKLI